MRVGNQMMWLGKDRRVRTLPPSGYKPCRAIPSLQALFAAAFKHEAEKRRQYPEPLA